MWRQSAPFCIKIRLHVGEKSSGLLDTELLHERIVLTFVLLLQVLQVRPTV